MGFITPKNSEVQATRTCEILTSTSCLDMGIQPYRDEGNETNKWILKKLWSLEPVKWELELLKYVQWQGMKFSFMTKVTKLLIKVLQELKNCSPALWKNSA